MKLTAIVVLATLLLTGCATGTSDIERRINIQTACEARLEAAAGLDYEINRSTDEYGPAENDTFEARMEMTAPNGETVVLLCAASGTETFETTEITRIVVNGIAVP